MWFQFDLKWIWYFLVKDKVIESFYLILNETIIVYLINQFLLSALNLFDFKNKFIYFFYFFYELQIYKKSNWLTIIYIYIYMCVWEPKMCRPAWQLLGLLGNVLGLLGMLGNVLGMPWQRPRHACNVLGLLGMLPARS